MVDINQSDNVSDTGKFEHLYRKFERAYDTSTRKRILRQMSNALFRLVGSYAGANTIKEIRKTQRQMMHALWFYSDCWLWMHYAQTTGGRGFTTGKVRRRKDTYGQESVVSEKQRGVVIEKCLNYWLYRENLTENAGPFAVPDVSEDSFLRFLHTQLRNSMISEIRREYTTKTKHVIIGTGDGKRTQFSGELGEDSFTARDIVVKAKDHFGCLMESWLDPKTSENSPDGQCFVDWGWNPEIHVTFNKAVAPGEQIQCSFRTQSRRLETISEFAPDLGKGEEKSRLDIAQNGDGALLSGDQVATAENRVKKLLKNAEDLAVEYRTGDTRSALGFLAKSLALPADEERIREVIALVFRAVDEDHAEIARQRGDKGDERTLRARIAKELERGRLALGIGLLAIRLGKTRTHSIDPEGELVDLALRYSCAPTRKKDGMESFFEKSLNCLQNSIEKLETGLSKSRVKISADALRDLIHEIETWRDET